MKPEIYVDSIESLQSTMHELIPVSSAMGIRVQSYDGSALVVTAPLAANINHQQSAFGGSLFSVAVLAGWGLMQLKLSELQLDCNTVIMGAEVTYQRPVFEDLVCTCRLPDNAAALFEELAHAGKMSTRMTSRYTVADKTAMEVVGRYHVRQITR